MYEYVFHPVTHGALGVSWHHLPALYMLERHLMVMAVMGCTAIIILLILMPVMRKRLATVLVVSACTLAGFLIGYSISFPDWQVGYITLPPDTISYQQWALPHHSIRIFYSLVLGAHIGLVGANVTLVATPYGETCPFPLGQGSQLPCFPELNPWRCPPGVVNTNLTKALLKSLSTTPNPLFWEGNQSTFLPPRAKRSVAGRRLFAIEEEIEQLYSGKNLKPVHFPRAASPSTENETNDSLLPRDSESSVVLKLGNSSVNQSFFNGSSHMEAEETVAKTCRPVDENGLIPALYDEWVDFEYGVLSLSHIEKLSRGVPAPILTMSEYLSRRYDFGAGGGEGGTYGGFYNWAHHVRYSGHYTSCLLYAALICWIFSLPLQMAEPESGAQLLGISGTLMAAAAPLYAYLLGPYPTDMMKISGMPLTLKWGACFYASLLGGLWTAATGFGMAVLRHLHRGAISTDLDLEELESHRISVPSDGLPSVTIPRSGTEFTRV